MYIPFVAIFTYNLSNIFCNIFTAMTMYQEMPFYTLVKFRTSNHRLPIETGRWSNIYVPRNKKACIFLCEKEVGDEFHDIMTCSSLNDCRKCYLPDKYTNRPNTLKFFNLFSCQKDIHIT
jgi:hypothetical protein